MLTRLTSQAVVQITRESLQCFARVSDGDEGDGAFSLFWGCRYPALVSYCGGVTEAFLEMAEM